MIALRRGVDACKIASLISAALAWGNCDHSNAIAPVTNGAAALVPLAVNQPSGAAKLVILSPGARNPSLPIEAPKLDWLMGRPTSLQAVTGITQGCRVIAELVISP